MTAQYGDGSIVNIAPQNRMFAAAQTQTSEAALLTRWTGQLYVVLGEGDTVNNGENRWQVRVWWKPFVMLIWYGGILVALGGLLAMIGRLRRGWKQRKQREFAEVTL
jgi:cytochrome c-type biogenesis protein CcmF